MSDVMSSIPRLVAVQVTAGAKKRGGKTWRIGTVIDGEQCSGYLAGWHDVWFHSYSACVQAIDFVTHHTASRAAYKAWRKDQRGKAKGETHARNAG